MKLGNILTGMENIGRIQGKFPFVPEEIGNQTFTAPLHQIYSRQQGSYRRQKQPLVVT